MHSREKLKNVLVRKPGRKSYYFSPILAKISSSRISYYFQLLKLAVVEFPTIFVIKFFSGMSLPQKINGNSSFYQSADPPGPWTAKTTVSIYISRKCTTAKLCSHWLKYLQKEKVPSSCHVLFLSIQRLDARTPEGNQMVSTFKKPCESVF